MSLPAASRMVDDLVRRGFVERHEDAEDRRMKRVRLTDDGGAVIRRLNAARLNGLEQFAQTLTDDRAPSSSPQALARCSSSAPTSPPADPEEAIR